jgi:hypothetical protein
MYHQVSLVRQIEHFLSRLLDRVLIPPRGVNAGWWALAVLGVLAVLLVGGFLLWTGPVARSRRAAPDRPLASGRRSAGDQFLDSQQLALAGDHGGAILACVRAIAAALEQREILPPRPGRTADEFAAEAGEALPAEAAAFRAAAAAFDDVCYGGRTGTPAGYQQVAALAGRIGISGRQAASRDGSAPATRVPAGSRTP